jgi:hypothetical protein
VAVVSQCWFLIDKAQLHCEQLFEPARVLAVILTKVCRDVLLQNAHELTQRFRTTSCRSGSSTLSGARPQSQTSEPLFNKLVTFLKLSILVLWRFDNRRFQMLLQCLKPSAGPLLARCCHSLQPIDLARMTQV